MFVSAYLKTLRRIVPICLTVLVGIDIGRFLMHHHTINFGWIILVQIVVLFLAALVFSPIEYFKLSSHRD